MKLEFVQGCEEWMRAGVIEARVLRVHEDSVTLNIVTAGAADLVVTLRPGAQTVAEGQAQFAHVLRELERELEE